MTQKKMYKVLVSIPKHDGTGEWSMRVGNAFENRDGSMNAYLDAVPTHLNPKGGITLHIRELDERDLQQREAYRVAKQNRTASPAQPSSAAESLPF